MTSRARTRLEAGHVRARRARVAGTREGATYGKVRSRRSSIDARYGPDMYDPMQSGYTATDRARVLWAPSRRTAAR